MKWERSRIIYIPLREGGKGWKGGEGREVLLYKVDDINDVVGMRICPQSLKVGKERWVVWSGLN